MAFDTALLVLWLKLIVKVKRHVRVVDETGTCSPRNYTCDVWPSHNDLVLLTMFAYGAMEVLDLSSKHHQD